jgi:hypothetical protein
VSVPLSWEEDDERPKRIEVILRRVATDEEVGRTWAAWDEERGTYELSVEWRAEEEGDDG